MMLLNPNKAKYKKKDPRAYRGASRWDQSLSDQEGLHLSFPFERWAPFVANGQNSWGS